MSNVDHRQHQYDEENVARELIEHLIERSLSQEHFLGTDDKLSAGWLVVWVVSQVVYDQPAQHGR